ncbi:hypothetical protein [Herpetosiphon giganteus]|uniref:hypothetical protein n=1 Tax=Herpetosiphon giganteus TaxID=2029754 RepID=UPI00195647F0|nr:hypothetical protein [Herpetosiphon giganteus]MBM7843033.1 hypothetical protein [Herpetosiphon giganteus]
MTTGKTELITIALADSIDSILQQVRNAKAEHVDIFMPEGSISLQSRKTCDRLRETANREGIELTLYTSDPKVVKAALTCQMMVVEIEPSVVGSKPAPAAAAPAPPVAPVSPEEDFLASLEGLPTASTTDRLQTSSSVSKPIASQPIPKPAPQQPRSEIDDWADALDSLSVASTAGETGLRQHEQARGNDNWDFDGFNDFSDTLSGDSATVTAPPARPRIRPEDIELTSDDLHRQDAKARRARSEQKRADEKAELKQQNAPKRNYPLWGMLILAAIAIAALLWFLFGNRGVSGVTVLVRPAPSLGGQTYQDVRLNYQADPISEPSSAAIQGRLITVPISVPVRGTVITATEQPDQAAAGRLEVYNRNTQAYPIPANTRVKVLNAAGEEIVFLTQGEVTIPEASSSITGVTNGVGAIQIVASAGGTRYNMPASGDVIWTIEGYEGALFAINSEPVQGGTTALLKLPTEADWLPLLPQAVAQFRSAIPAQMQTVLQEGEVLADVNFLPNVDDLTQDPSLYDVQTRPVAGTDGDFELIVTANFQGLAVRGNFAEQLNRALPNALRIKDPSFSTDTSSIVKSEVRLDDSGASLLLATVEVAPKTNLGLPDSTKLKIAESIKGLTPAEAMLQLQALRESGLIGDIVSVPEVERLPLDPAEINVQVQE